MTNNLRTIRTMRDMTQARLAEITGISRINIIRYENHEINPGLESFVKIARALNVTVDDLVREDYRAAENPEQHVMIGAEQR